MKKIYSFDGKKRIIDNFDTDPSPLHLGQKFNAYGDDDAPPQEIEAEEEKQIEN
ncbi:MAG: hypothetical protein ACI4XH_10505 [Acutalibacteraceae bacterium]